MDDPSDIGRFTDDHRTQPVSEAALRPRRGLRIFVGRLVTGFLHDMRYALRGFRRSPVFSLVAIASLAIGIGANTAMFSLVHAVLIEQISVSEPDRLVTFTQTSAAASAPVVLPLTTIVELSNTSAALSGVFGRVTRPVNWSTDEDAEWVNGEMVTGQYFQTLRARPAIGRLLDENDVRDAVVSPVCVLSYAFWQRAFGGDPDIVDHTIFLNGHPYRVIGVTEPRFEGPELHRRFDIVIPATRIGDFDPTFAGSTGDARMTSMSWLAPMARLADGHSRVNAQQEVQQLLQAIDPGRQAEVRLADGSQGFNTVRPAFGQPVLVLMGLVALMLLVTCANLANLLLARGQARAQELAVRMALGASRARLFGQLLLEVLLLVVGGGGASIALSFWITGTVVSFVNTGQPATSPLQVEPNMYVLVFSALLSLATVCLVGLVPGWRATRPDLVEDLKPESMVSSLPSGMLLRRSLIVTQVTLSFVVVVGAGLLTRTLQQLATVDLGYDPERVVALNVDPPAAGYSEAEAAGLLDELLIHARELPGVRAASLASSTPGGDMLTSNVDVPGYIPRQIPGDTGVSFKFISPQYFETMGQALLRGRDFNGGDTRASARVAIVNQAFVNHYLNDRNPVGVEFREGQVSMTIVGVVADAREFSVRSTPDETVYLPERQAPPGRLTLLARAEIDPQQIIPSLTGVVRTIDRRMPVFSVHTLDKEVAAGLSSERILGYLSTLFAAFTVLVAAIGLHGVMSYSTSHRTFEVGIRLALGAQKRDLVTSFGRESLTLVVVGLSLGVPMALGSARVLGGLLFGVAPDDTLTLTGSAVVVLSICLLATVPSLLRISRIDPAIVLRWT